MEIIGKYITDYIKGKTPKNLFDSQQTGLLPYLSPDYLRGKAEPEQYCENKDNAILVDNGEVINLDAISSTQDLKKKGKLKNVQIVRLSDKPNGISFVFEPNEKSSFCFNPVKINRPGFQSSNIGMVNLTYASTLFWDINIDAGRETEKSINFTIIPVKKIKS